MSSFTNATGFMPVANSKLWQVTETFHWYINNPNGVKITVPKGFVFNGADIPFPITALWPRVDPDYMQSAALHDYCLDNLRHLYTRKFIDIQFHESLLALGNSKIKALCMYLAVTYFGIFTEWDTYWKVM